MKEYTQKYQLFAICLALLFVTLASAYAFEDKGGYEIVKKVTAEDEQLIAGLADSLNDMTPAAGYFGNPKPHMTYGVQGGWLMHAVHYAPNNRPKIAVVIDDMGVNYKNSMRVLELNAPLTLSYLPYAQNIREQTAEAKGKGFELMVHVPMQPLGKSDPGPDVLKADLTPVEIMARLDNALNKFDGYVGINNHMGSAFTQNEKGMRYVLSELQHRGLLFLDSRTTSKTVGGKIAKEMKMPYAVRDVFIDHEDGEYIQRALRKLEKVALDNGSAVAIGHPHSQTITELEKWIPMARARGFDIVPLSAIVKQDYIEAAGILEVTADTLVE